MTQFLILSLLISNPIMADDAACRFPHWNKLADALKDPLRVANILLKTEKENCSDARRFYRIAEENVTQWKKDVRPWSERIRLAMVLKQGHSDGDFAESIDEYLGFAIEKRPRDFLVEAIDSLPEGKWCTPGMVANFGDYGSMPEKDRKKRLADRKKALQAVKDTNLQKIVKQCISVIPR